MRTPQGLTSVAIKGDKTLRTHSSSLQKNMKFFIAIFAVLAARAFATPAAVQLVLADPQDFPILVRPHQSCSDVEPCDHSTQYCHYGFCYYRQPAKTYCNSGYCRLECLSGTYDYNGNGQNWCTRIPPNTRFAGETCFFDTQCFSFPDVAPTRCILQPGSKFGGVIGLCTVRNGTETTRK